MDKKRYEKEIEEILAKYDQESGRKEKTKPEGPTLPGAGGPGTGFRPSVPGPINSPRRRSKPSFTFSLRNISAGQYMVSAFALAILAIFVRAFSPGLAGIMVIAAAALFLVPVLLYRSPGGGASPHEEKRWRGQVIDFSTRRDVTNDPFAAIKRWFKRR